MRFHSVLAAAAMLTAATPAFASTIFQDLPAVQTSGDSTPFDIDGAPFNPALGTLTAVTATLMGSYSPEPTYSGGPGMLPSPGIVSTNYFLYAGPPGSGNFFSGTLPPQTITPTGATVGGGAYIGAPASVDLAFNFPLVSAFISPAPGPFSVAEFGFLSSVAHGEPFPFSLSDATNFDGTFALTYTYNGAAAVPEPASLLILGFGAGLIPLLKRRRAA